MSKLGLASEPKHGASRPNPSLSEISPIDLGHVKRMEEREVEATCNG